ncbi:MAG: efflux RND transporter permease subunit, partial [Myxococcota bacterium]|nr:efflux RND transporter permease subunit [Myxococcota bacterium]
MRALIAKAIEQRRITLVLTAALSLYGLTSYFTLPKQESPDVTVPVAMITTIYPGASAETVEKLVTRRIEDAASEVRGFESVRSYSRSSVSIVGVNLRQGTDYELAWQELKDRLNDVEALLPRGARKPAIRTNLAETAGMIIALSSQSYSYDQLAGFAESFKRGLSSVEGITRFEVVGEIDKRVEVIFEVDKLNQYGFSLEDVTRILQAQNIEIPSGRIESGRFKIDVSAPGIFESLKDIENVIIDVSRDSGAPVRLRDVAKVEMALEPGSYRVRQDGQRAVLLCGFFQPSKNVVDVGVYTRQVIDRVKRSFP